MFLEKKGKRSLYFFPLFCFSSFFDQHFFLEERLFYLEFETLIIATIATTNAAGPTN